MLCGKALLTRGAKKSCLEQSRNIAGTCKAVPDRLVGNRARGRPIPGAGIPQPSPASARALQHAILQRTRQKIRTSPHARSPHRVRWPRRNVAWHDGDPTRKGWARAWLCKATLCKASWAENARLCKQSNPFCKEPSANPLEKNKIGSWLLS